MMAVNKKSKMMGSNFYKIVQKLFLIILCSLFSANPGVNWNHPVDQDSDNSDDWSKKILMLKWKK